MKTDNKTIKIEQGSGGAQSAELIAALRNAYHLKNNWTNQNDDAAVYDLGDKKLVFTTDAFIVDPIFFPGGDIGKLAVCGTINDLSVMGAQPIGLSVSLVIEEGFSRTDLQKISESINKISQKTGIPIVTGDTKVIDKGKIDKIEITTSGVGLAHDIISNSGARPGDNIIASGDLGEHTAVILSKRFDYQTDLISDCQPLTTEIQSILPYLHACKDPTRGGMAANLNEIADKSKVKIVLSEKNLPYKKAVTSICNLLGLSIFDLASEGRFIAAVDPDKTDNILAQLKNAKIIGKVETGSGLYLKTSLDTLKEIRPSSGKLIPRIC